MKTSELNINGMGCAGCVDTVHSALTELDGVNDAVVDLGEGRATVEYDENEVDIVQFEKAISEAGYEVVKE
ncbi:MAG: heavy metal-associated domain-containing protein [Balneolaceae bacterium]